MPTTILPAALRPELFGDIAAVIVGVMSVCEDEVFWVVVRWLVDSEVEFAPDKIGVVGQIAPVTV